MDKQQQEPSSIGDRLCHYCGITAQALAPKELRPYGPGGSDICFACMKASPERKAAAKSAFGTLLEANATVGGGVVTIGTEHGPTPGATL